MANNALTKYLANPSTTLDDDDLIYILKAITGTPADSGIVYSDLLAQLATAIAFSDTYTPTLYNTTNVAASTAHVCRYTRSGDHVIVEGIVDITATATGNTLLGMTLPIASTISNFDELAGAAAAFAVLQSLGIYGDTVNNRAIFRYQAVGTTARSYPFFFGYNVA
jgi:hypothetical protein